MIDKNGKNILNQEFFQVSGFRNNISTFKTLRKFKLTNKNNISIINKLFDEISEVNINNFNFVNRNEKSKKLLKFRLNNKYAIADNNGKILTHFIFDEVENYNFVKVDGKWGVIDENLNYIFSPKFDEVVYKSEKILYLKLNNKYAIADYSGKILIDFIFDEVKNYNFVKLNGKWGLIDETGKFITQPKFDDIGYKSKGITSVKIDNKWCYINDLGKFLFEPKFDDLGKFKEKFESFSLAKLNGKWGLINETGKFIVQPKFDEIRSLNACRYLEVKLNGKEFYVSMDEKEIIENHTFFSNLKIVSIDEKIGLMNQNFEIIIPVIYDSISERKYKKSFYKRVSSGFPIHDITDNFFDLELNNKFGLINNDGKIIVEPKYDFIGFYSNDLAPVKLNGKWGLIDQTGKEVLEPNYDTAEDSLKKYKKPN